MCYRGRVENGVIVLEPPGTILPEGLEVTIHPNAEPQRRARWGGKTRNGLPVLDVPPDATPITNEMILDAEDEL